jgi:ATP-dependent DNA ligase
MLAKLVRELPSGDAWTFEPKWDGFRCLAFRDGDDVDLRSRNERPFSRYFPEIAEALRRSIACDRFVADGELMVLRDGRFDFDALMTRLHPSRTWVERHAAETPATFVAFDVIAFADRDLREIPFVDRRRCLEELFSDAEPPLHVTPISRDPAVATRWLDEFRGGGLDGVVAKADDLRYEAGKRSMLKVKTQRTADCVVAGFRFLAAKPVVSSLLLGVHGANGRLHHVGVASSFTAARRAELVEELRPYAGPLDGHPWERGFGEEGGRLGRLKGTAGRWVPEMGLDWVPLRPELVCEVAYDQMEGTRFRHPSKFLRWRPDRDPASCTFDQFDLASEPVPWPSA